MAQVHPSLASATGTRFDSAAKHTLQCRVDTDILREWAPADMRDDARMHQNKYQFAMQKDELVMNSGIKMFPTDTVHRQKGHAYPPVLTTLSALHPRVRAIVVALYAQETPEDFCNLIADARGVLRDNPASALQLSSMPLLHVQGVALTTAFASYVSGDTVGTVLIGGIHTINNGAFEMRPGQLVQWYLEDETELFNADTSAAGRTGSRRPIQHQISLLERMLDNDVRPDAFADANFLPPHPAGQVGKRKSWHDRAYGMENGAKSKSVFRIKPYVEDGDVHYGDRVRVFAKCINGGRAYDQVDIMLMTQSM